MKRREFFRFVGGAVLAAVLGAAFSTTLAWSQSPDKPRRVGVLVGASLSDPGIRRLWNALVDGLREHGWVEGRNVIFEVRETGPDPARFPDLAMELVALKVDVIVGANMQAIEAARRATATVPRASPPGLCFVLEPFLRPIPCVNPTVNGFTVQSGAVRKR